MQPAYETHDKDKLNTKRDTGRDIISFGLPTSLIAFGPALPTLVAGNPSPKPATPQPLETTPSTPRNQPETTPSTQNPTLEPPLNPKNPLWNHPVPDRPG